MQLHLGSLLTAKLASWLIAAARSHVAANHTSCLHFNTSTNKVKVVTQSLDFTHFMNSLSCVYLKSLLENVMKGSCLIKLAFLTFWKFNATKSRFLRDRNAAKAAAWLVEDVNVCVRVHQC